MRRHLDNMLEEGFYNPDQIPKLALGYILKHLKSNIMLRCYTVVYVMLLITSLLRVSMSSVIEQTQQIQTTPMQEYEYVKKNAATYAHMQINLVSFELGTTTIQDTVNKCKQVLDENNFIISINIF